MMMVCAQAGGMCSNEVPPAVPYQFVVGGTVGGNKELQSVTAYTDRPGTFAQQRATLPYTWSYTVEMPENTVWSGTLALSTTGLICTGSNTGVAAAELSYWGRAVSITKPLQVYGRIGSCTQGL